MAFPLVLLPRYLHVLFECVPLVMGGNEIERGRRDHPDQMLQMMEKDRSLANTAKTVPPPGQGTAAGGGEYRRQSRFADAQPQVQDVPEKRPPGYTDAPPRPPVPADNRSSFHGFGQPPNPPSLAQSGVGDFRGLQDKMKSLYPASSSEGTETRPGPGAIPPFMQPPPGFARPPPTSGGAPTAFGMGGPHWSGASSSANGSRQDWRPGFSGAERQNPAQQQQQQQRLPGNWQGDGGMPFNRFY